MGASPSLVAQGTLYTALELGSSIIIMLLFLNNAIFRGAGDAATAMRVLAIGNGISIVLDPLFVFGWGPFPEMGLAGAAVGTVIGRGFGVLIQLWLLVRPGGRVTIRLRDFRVVPRVLASLVRVSATGVLQFTIAHTSWVLLVRIISEFGSVAVAGYTVGIRIFAFWILPAWGLAGAASTMVGQNLGAKKPERAERAVYLTGFYNTLFLAVVGLFFVGSPEPMVRWFTSDAGVVAHGVDCLRIVGCGNLAYAFGMVLVQAFNGAGDTVTPTLVNVAGFWLMEIPLAWALAFPAALEVRGVFIAIPISEAFITVVSIVLFRRGAWKRRAI
jgi:putative MATE family efflux protein